MIISIEGRSREEFVLFCLIKKISWTITLCLLLIPRISEAQLLPGFNFDSRQFTIEQLSETHVRLTGEVEIDGGSWQFYADQVDIFSDDSRLLAHGNVVYSTDGSRVAANRVEFNTQTLTGTFFNASGSVVIVEDVERSMFGSQEPDMHFYGEIIEKTGPRTYRLTNGGFTSCIQPTPRWQVTASTVTLNLNDYAFLRNSILEVKGVPVFYLPVMYYPIQEDGRATGFLIPTYGASTFRGQSLSNAFFWAINRSHDATIFHDWFTQTGQGIGAEYRYTLEQGSEGFARGYFLNEREATVSRGGVTKKLPARRSYEVRGRVRQALPGNLTARANVDFFSDITVQQTYYGNVFEASNRERSLSGNVSGSWGSYRLSGTFEVNETFFGDRESTLWGGGPRITFGQSRKSIPKTPFYFSFDSEYVRLLRTSITNIGEKEKKRDSGLQRVDFNPVLQLPFTRWPFLTINSTIAWRGTYWSESIDPNTKLQIPNSIARTHFEVSSRITGPSFVKVWDTPNSGYAERMKHVIEPWVTLRRVSAIDEFKRIVRLESLDSIVGEVTEFRYGLNNRIYAKQTEDGGPAVAREILSIGLSQSYYTDARASQFDPRFQSSFNQTKLTRPPPSNYSPLSLIVRSEPTRSLSGSMRAEYDTQFKSIRTISADGTIAVGGWMQTTAGWSQRRFIKGLPGFDNPKKLDHYLNIFTSMKNPNNSLGGSYSINYDLLREQYLQQRLLVYYNAQCCGISLEVQLFNFEGLGVRAPVTSDKRINLSFTLAGLGTFANVFGAFGGTDQMQ